MNMRNNYAINSVSTVFDTVTATYSRRMFHHVLCQEPEALQWWLAAINSQQYYTMGGLFIDKLL